VAISFLSEIDIQKKIEEPLNNGSRVLRGLKLSAKLLAWRFLDLP